MNLLLTGNVNIGKSTIIHKVIQVMNIQPAGFYTKPVWIDQVIVGFKMYDYHHRTSPFWIGIKDTPLTCQPITENFNVFGSQILDDCLQEPYIILDEIGFLERHAYAYQSKITALLDADITVLGVIKPKVTPFLNKIRARKDIILIEVTENNRNWLAFYIIQLLNNNS